MMHTVTKTYTVYIQIMLCTGTEYMCIYSIHSTACLNSFCQVTTQQNVLIH